MDLVQIILFLVVAAIAGTAANALIGRNHGSTVTNTLLGIIGAFVGQFIFNALDINLTGALNEGITLGEVLVAMVGALVVILVVRAIQR